MRPETGFDRVPTGVGRSRIEHDRIRAYFLLILYDAAIFNLAFLTVSKIYVGEWFNFTGETLGPQICTIYLAIAFFNGLYSLKGIDNIRWALGKLITTLLVATSVWLAISFLAKNTVSYSRVVLVSGLMVSFIGMGLSRYVMNWRLKRKLGPRLSYDLIVLAGGPAIEEPDFFTINATGDNARLMVGNPDLLAAFGESISGMDRIIVSCPASDRSAWTYVLKAAGVRGEVISDPLRDLGALGLSIDAKFTSIVVSAGPLRLRDRVIKRGIDLTITIPAIIALAPLYLLIAAFIKLEDGGPIIFSQQRIGRGNRYFQTLKFRTMSAEQTNADGSLSASRDDCRVTRIGRILRRTSLDEIPQLLNVLRSDMSLVGPRPHAKGSLAGERLFWEVDRDYWRRHSIKPGLTGLAQIRGHRGATEAEDDLKNRLQADLEYVSQWTPLLDLKIIARTARVMIHKNAY